MWSTKGTQISNSCGSATAQIIWTDDCGNSAQNENILAALIAAVIDPERVRTSKIDCGTYFFTAPLTEKQIKDIEKNTAGIKAIVDDNAATISSFSAIRQMHKRAGNVVIEDFPPEHLAYISTPPGSKTRTRFAYLENAGAGITGYWIDQTTAITSDDGEFSTHNVIKGNLNALAPAEADFEPEDERLATHAPCMASLAAGAKYGVARKASLIMVQAALRDSSFLDALQKIRAHLQQEQLDGHEVRGYTVIGTTNVHPRRPDRVNESKAEEAMKELINEFQVVFVAATGNAIMVNGLPFRSEIDRWPAIWASKPDLPMITVGAIDMKDGKSTIYSLKGPARTVSAPGSVWCNAGTKYGERPSMGTSNSAALAFGQILDYLSRDYVRAHLNLQENVNRNPSTSVGQKLRKYMVQKAYPRAVGDARVIWNGLWPDRPERQEP